MRRTVAILALLVAVSGCSDPDAASPLGEDPDQGEGNTTAPAPVPSVPDPLRAFLNASASEGGVPLTVSFDIGATGTTDPIWAVDFGDGSAPVNGSDIPATTEHTFASSGGFSVVLTVTDGDEVAYATVNITAAGALALPVQERAFSYQVGSASCADPADPLVFGTPANGVLWSEWAIDPATIGQTYVVSYSGPNTVFRIGFMAFYGADDHLIAFAFEDGGDITGTVPEGAVHGVFSDCAAGPVTGHYATTGTLGPIP